MNPNLIKGSLSTIILRLLSEHQRMYGYEIAQKVKELSQGEVLVTEGALYPALHKLEAEELVITESVIVDGRARKYYLLTPKGAQIGVSRVADLLQSLQNLQLILYPQIT